MHSIILLLTSAGVFSKFLHDAHLPVKHNLSHTSTDGLLCIRYSTTRWKRWQIDGLGSSHLPHLLPAALHIVSCIYSRLCSSVFPTPFLFCILYPIIPQREGSQFPSSPLIFVLHLTQAVRLAPFPPAPAYDLILRFRPRPPLLDRSS